MTVKELKAELDCYDEDVDVVFEFDDDVRVNSWTEDRWGGKKVSIDAFLKPTFMSDHRGKCWIELGVEEEN